MIRENIGKVFDWLQTESAYPNGPLPAATCHVERAARLGMLPELADTLVIGPGTSAELEALSKYVAGPKFVLTALAREAVEPGMLYYPTTVGDMHDMYYLNGIFNFVFANNVMEHALAPYVALLEVRRVLRLDGWFHMVVPTFETPGGDATPWHLYCLDQKMWRSLLYKTGFRVVRVEFTKEAIGSASHFEHYMHFSARAVEPPHPHDELLRRLIDAKR